MLTLPATASRRLVAPRRDETRSRHTLQADSTNATQPAQLGDAMDVPFMSCEREWFHAGMGATAPPGAVTQTPACPSDVGPRDDHVYYTTRSVNVIANNASQ